MLSLLQTNAGDKAVTAITDILDKTPFLSVRIRTWIVVAAIWIILLACCALLRKILGSRLGKLAERTATRFDDVVVKVIKDQRIWLYFFVVMYIASLYLHIPKSLAEEAKADQADIDRLRDILKYIAVVATAIQLFLSSRLVVDFALEQLLDKTKTPDGKPDPSIRGSLVVLRFVVMLVVATGVCLLALENFGVKIGPMITGLGIGGIAIALAIQKVLGDLLASVSILMDKPFVVGDYVQIGDKNGTVEVIGLKTTRMRAPTGEQIIFGNSDILNSRIHNYQRLEERRVTSLINIANAIPPDKLREIPRIVKAVIDKDKLVRFDRCHFKTISERSYVYEVSYLVLSSDYLVYMDSQERVYLGILEAFAREQVKIYFIP